MIMGMVTTGKNTLLLDGLNYFDLDVKKLNLGLEVTHRCGDDISVCQRVRLVNQELYPIMAWLGKPIYYQGKQV